MKKIIYSAMALVALCGCSEGGDVAQAPYDGEVRLCSTIASRVDGDQWESGDQIGVRMSYGSNISEKAIYTTDATGALNTSTPLYYPAEGMVDIQAYYPYTVVENGSVAELDVNEQADQKALDFLSASVTGRKRNAMPVPLMFYHRMAQVVITSITAEAGVEGELDGIKVEVVGTKATAQYDVQTDQLTLSGEATDIAMKMGDDGLSAQATVIPQEATAKLRFTTTSGTIYYVALPNREFEEGMVYLCSAKLKKEFVVLGEITIADWGYGQVNDPDIEMRPDPSMTI